MHEWLILATEYTVVVINMMALLMIVIGAVGAFFAAIKGILTSSRTGERLREGYVNFAQWLIAGLTFQLAADIIETATAPGWEDIGQLASIAVIRTFLSYFLERDIKEMKEGLFEREAG